MSKHNHTPRGTTRALRRLQQRCGSCAMSDQDLVKVIDNPRMHDEKYRSFCYEVLAWRGCRPTLLAARDVLNNAQPTVAA